MIMVAFAGANAFYLSVCSIMLFVRRPQLGILMSILGSTLRCSFCDRDRRDVAKLVAGPHVYICDLCVSRANAHALATRTPHERRRSTASAQCSFCARPKDAAAVTRAHDCTICPECLVLVTGIISASDEPPRRTRPKARNLLGRAALSKLAALFRVDRPHARSTQPVSAS